MKFGAGHKQARRDASQARRELINGAEKIGQSRSAHQLLFSQHNNVRQSITLAASGETHADNRDLVATTVLALPALATDC